MNYPRDTYIKYNVFCKTVVLETKAMLDVANLGFTWGTVLIIIAKLLGVGIPIFVGVSILTSAGALTYFGSIGALIAANPVMAGILLGATGMGLFQIFRLIWKKKHVLEIVKETVVDRYQGDFDYLFEKLSSSEDLSQAHISAVEALIKRASIDLLNSLVEVGELTKDQVNQIVQAIELGAL